MDFFEQQMNDERQRGVARKDSLLKWADRRKLYLVCFDTPAGREVLKDLIGRTPILGQTYMRNEDTCYLEGVRRVVLDFWSLMPDIMTEEMERYSKELVTSLDKEIAVLLTEAQ
jgi:hypothetical protein